MKFVVGKDKKEYILNKGDTLIIPSFVEHEAFVLEETEEVDIFSPIREDWINGTDNYLKR